MNTKPFTAVMVSETHWDRAWYLPFQAFRIRLVRLVDRVIDILDRDPAFHSFMLDGQMLPIEDYLEIRPERRADLERLVRAGRLWAGPWYALADEYLVSPESLIRNLMLGTRMAQELGGPSAAPSTGSGPSGPEDPSGSMELRLRVGLMREGYVPDAFGHIGQLPQILKGFGIDSAIFWRGVGDEGEELGTEFWWNAPDGSRVLAIHLPDGYHNAANLGYPMRWGDPSGMEFNTDWALRRLRDAVNFLKPYAHTRYLLLMNGIDHAEAEPKVPAIIARVNEELPDVHIEHSSLPDYIARVRQAAGDDLPSFKGEFNRGRYAVILQGVYSTRMYLKQANERVQTLLECYAEPLSAWAWLLGNTYPGEFLWAAWRKLLKNHPHDDICGCSVDLVHREMMTRFGEAEQIGSVIARNSYRTVMRSIDRTAQPCTEPGQSAGVPFVMYNPVGWPRSETVEVNLHFDPSPDGVLRSSKGSGHRLDDDTANDFHLVDASGQPVPFQVLDHGEHFEMEVLKANRKHEVRVAMAVDALPPCGYRVYFALPGGASPEVEAPVQMIPNGMENRYLRVTINPDGSLNVFDKATQHQFRNLGYFSDDEDAGDEYDYSPCPHGENVSSLGRPAQIRLIIPAGPEEGPSRPEGAGLLQVTYEISLRLPIPAALIKDRQRRSGRRVTCPIVTTVTLRRDSRTLEMRTTIDNRARDHRLRVCFPTNLIVDEATADGHFDVVTRPIDLPAGEAWAQPPVPTCNQRYFVDVTDGRTGLAVFNRGLPEYEILRDGDHNPALERSEGTIAITLLRCVDMISRGDLLTRPEHAGIPCPAPEGQCLGEHTFEYALYPHAGDWRAVYQAAHIFRAPVYLRRGDEHEGYVPGEVWPDDIRVEEPVILKSPDPTGSLPPELSFLTLDPEELVLSAVKRSEEGDRLIVRFYNPTSESVQATVRMFRPIRIAQAVNLNEEPQADLGVDQDGALTLSVGGKQVRTVALQI